MEKLESLVPNIELCRELKKKYPELETSFSWFGYKGCSYIDNQVDVGKLINYSVRQSNTWEIGLNFGAMRFVEEITPAYMLHDLIGLYNGDEKIKSSQQLAELLIK